VGLDALMKAGERVRFMDPEDFYGKPVLEGVYGGEPVAVPVEGSSPRSCPEGAGGVARGRRPHGRCGN